MKYIKKEFTNNSLQTYECWVAKTLKANVSTGKATIEFVGYKNAEAFISGADPDSSMTKNITVDFEDLQTYESLWQELTLKSLSLPNSPFLGATVADTNGVE